MTETGGTGVDSNLAIGKHGVFHARILTMSDEKYDYAHIAKRELVILAVFLVAGVCLLPIAVFLVGGLVFGEHPDGMGAFVADIWDSLLEGDLATWFLVLSPYLVWIASRLTWRGMRRPHGRVAE
jgi:hypothetical protein